MNSSAMNSSLNHCARVNKPARAALLVLALVLLTAALTGCSAAKPEPVEKKSPTQLKVLYSSRQSFYQDYGNFILLRMPDIEFKVIPTDPLYEGDTPISEKLTKLVEEQQPDLLFLPTIHQRILEDNNQLLPLNGLLSDKALANVPDNVKKLLYKGGESGGELYGVATSFTSEALFYNKDLFASAGVPVPEERMNWKAFVDVARRFAGSPTPGFYTSSVEPFSMMMQVGRSEGLTWMNPQLTFNTDGWAQVLETIKPLYDDKVVLAAENISFDDPFLNQQAAMTIAGADYYRQLERTDVPFEWGVLPVPSGDPSRIQLDLMYGMAINRDSVNAEAAARVIDFIMSDSLDVLEKSVKSSLPATVASPIARDPQHPLHFMYTQPANPISGVNQNDGLPNISVQSQYDLSMYQIHQVREIVNGVISVREGLRSIEEFSQTLQ